MAESPNTDAISPTSNPAQYLASQREAFVDSTEFARRKLGSSSHFSREVKPKLRDEWQTSNSDESLKNLEGMTLQDQHAVDSEVWWTNDLPSSDETEFPSTFAVIETENVSEDLSSFAVDNGSEFAEFPEVDNDDIPATSPSTLTISGPKLDSNPPQMTEAEEARLRASVSQWMIKRAVAQRVGVLSNKDRKVYLGLDFGGRIVDGWTMAETEESFAEMGIVRSYTPYTDMQLERWKKGYRYSKFDCFAISKLRWSWTAVKDEQCGWGRDMTAEITGLVLYYHLS